MLLGSHLTGYKDLHKKVYPNPHDEADWAVNFQFKQNKAWNFLILREVSVFLFWWISSVNYAIRQFYAKRCRILCRAKRALFAFSAKLERMVDECRPVKGCIKKRIHGSANGQPKLSTVKEANVKNMEVFVWTTSFPADSILPFIRFIAPSLAARRRNSRVRADSNGW